MPYTLDQITLGDRVVVAGTTVDGVEVVAKGYISNATWSTYGPSHRMSWEYQYFTNQIEINMGQSFRAVFSMEKVQFYSWEERPDVPDPVETRKEITP